MFIGEGVKEGEGINDYRGWRRKGGWDVREWQRVVICRLHFVVKLTVTGSRLIRQVVMI